MASYQLFGRKYPVVSIKGGASSAVKDIKNSLEFVEGFEFVVICFDQDKPGIEAANNVADLFAPGQARIVTLPLKDANEMLVANKVQE